MSLPPLASLLRSLAAVPVGYLVVWAVLAVLSAVFVVVARSRWGRSRPLQKCAVLSLLVHVLLACLAMTVRIVVGDGGGAAGQPIRVRLVDEVPTIEEQVTMVEPPPLLDAPPDQPPQEAVADASVPSEALEEVVGEDTTPRAQEDPAPRSSEDNSAPPVDSLATSTGEDAAPPSEPPPASKELAPIQELDSLEPVVTPTSAAPPNPYAQRSDRDRLRLVEEQGGSRETEAAVGAALDWLADAQSSDGRWDASKFGAGREEVVLGHNRQGAGAHADTGVSGLALLAFLGAGHTHRDGGYQRTVDRGLKYLVRAQSADGSLFGEASLYAQMYCHSMATFALAEALAMTGDRRLEPAVRRAIDFSLRAQHPGTGGWRYRVGDTGDTSQLGWQMMALASAERAGIEVPPHTWTGVERFLRSVRRGTTGGLAAYRPDGPPSTSMTAEALYCHLLLADTVDGAIQSGPASEATERLLASLPNRQRINLYYWYYGTLALHHRQKADDEAAAAWQTWNSALTDVLLGVQVADGPDAGSWSPNTVWGGYGGRVYTTALAALCLEVYYRYAPSPRDQWIATRPNVLPRN